jgi:quercetin dioxygenase-like cupin family protein
MQQDPVQVDSKHYRIELENDDVRVLRVSFGPHEKSPMHSHPRGLLVFLTDQYSQHTDSAGRIHELRGRPGEVQWVDPTDHLTENTTSKPWQMLFVELKP